MFTLTVSVFRFISYYYFTLLTGIEKNIKSLRSNHYSMSLRYIVNLYLILTIFFASLLQKGTEITN